MKPGVWISGRSAAYYLDPAFHFPGGFADFDPDIAEQGLLGWGRLVRWVEASVDPWEAAEALDRTFGPGAWDADEIRGPVEVSNLLIPERDAATSPPVSAPAIVWLFRPVHRVPVPNQYRGTVPVKRAKIPEGDYVVDLPAHWSDAHRLRGPFA